MFQQASKTKKGPSVLSLQSPKKMRSWANNQSETPKKLHSVGTFQNGINAHVKGSFKKNDYLAKIDLQDAYLKVENTINTFTSHEGTPLWSLLANCLASQAPQECSQNYRSQYYNFEAERHSTHSLPRRILHNGRFEANSTSTCGENIEYSRGVGIPDNTFTENSIPGVHGELGEHEFNSPQRQTPESPTSL